jgi:DNA-binding MarR family transcriptional regulator
VPLQLIPAIHRATHRIGIYLETIDDLGVTQAEAHILSHLVSHGDSTIAELHQAFAHKRSTLTSILDRLVARGLVMREVSEEDRRTFVVRLTRAGRSVAARAYERLEALEARVIARVPKERLQELLTALASVERVASEPPREGREAPRRKRATGRR